MEVACPRCNNSVRVNDVVAGGVVRVSCSACGAKFEVCFKKKTKLPVQDLSPDHELENATESTDGEVLEPTTDCGQENAGDFTSEARTFANSEPEYESESGVENVPESEVKNTPEAESDITTASSDPRRLAVLEQYRNEWKRRIDETELQREDAVLVSARKHNGELRRHKLKNLMVLAAYAAAFAALAFFLLQK